MRKLTLILLTLLVSSAAFALKSNNFKRGFGENNMYYVEDMEALAEGCTWFYTWGTNPNSYVSDYCGTDKLLEFVPMYWGPSSNINNIKAYYDAHPEEKYLLGFNEPNLTGNHGGSAMNPTLAAEKWHEIEAMADEYNLILIAPALNYSPDYVDGVLYSTPDMWMDAWINAYKAAYNVEPRYDYLALHSYMGSVTAMLPYIENFAKKYGKQVWLTEFASAPDGITETEASQQEKMIAMVNGVERSEYVHRYAWFKGRDTNTKAPFWGLITTPNEAKGIGKGHLSDLGYAYVHMSSYDMTKYYDVDENIPANQFVNCESLKRIQKSNDLRSADGSELYFEGMGASTTYQINVPSAGTYKLALRYSCASGSPRVNILDEGGNKLASAVSVPTTGSNDTYAELSIDITLPAGKQTLTVQKDNFAAINLSLLNVSTTGHTGIKAVTTTQTSSDNAWYTLQGARTEKPTQKGIYIHNNKKVVVK